MASPTAAPFSNASRLFFAAITLYFAVQVVLRLTLGGALETDEAEMMVMTPGLQLGYGPQLPLYNWVQVILFDLFGRSLFALAVLKNLLLWATYALMFLGLRLWMPARLAAVGALSLFLLPDVAWEAQRATTHSNMLLATSAAALAAFLWVLETGQSRAYVALGVAIGLGALAKYNFWLVPVGLVLATLSMAEFRARLVTLKSLVTVGVALAILALPYKWMLDNPSLAFSSTGKLAIKDDSDALQVLVSGISDLFSGYAVLMILPLLVLGGLYLACRSNTRVAHPAPAILRLLTRAAIVLAVIVAVGVALAGVGHVTPRWLLPVVFFAVPALFIHLFGRLSAAPDRSFAIVLLVLAGIVFVGLGFDRYKDRARRAVEFAPLAQALAEVMPSDQTPVVAEFFTAGNLARMQPRWRIAPYLGFAAPQFGGETVLFVLREKVPTNLKSGMRQAGWPAELQPEVLSKGALDLPFDSSDKTLPIRWMLVKTPTVDTRQ